MNSTDLRDKQRELKYLIEEEKVLLEMSKNVKIIKNQLKVEEIMLKNIIKSKENKDMTNTVKRETSEETHNNTYLSSGTPFRAVSIPMIHIPDDQSDNQPNAVVETLELDVSKVLLTLACGGEENNWISEDEEEYE